MKQLGPHWIYLYLYVDDIKWFYDPAVEQEVLRLIAAINEKYALNDTTSGREFTGMTIFDEGENVILEQSVFAAQIVADHWIQPSTYKSYAIPMSPDQPEDFDLLQDLTPDEKLEMTDMPYRTVIGKLMYLAYGSRPDLAFSHALHRNRDHVTGKQFNTYWDT
ncbi:hypothetical protein HDU67_010390 [Dinochytrium kinnereticum]|nr:hypothetical protein HDU67_010390 [Dinochytrium kinnereticum]